MILRWRLVTQNDIGSSLIQYFSAGRASHVGLILEDGSELSARFDRVGGKPPGVQIRPGNYARFATQTIIEMDVPLEQARMCRAFLFQQIGKPYDWKAIVGFAFDRNWRDEDAWICSELHAAAIEYAGICHPLYLQANKITPVACALVLSAIGGTIPTGTLQ